MDDVDLSILAGLRARERGAFDRLYARYRERIWTFLVRLCGNRSEAEELFQETWVSAARNAHRLAADSDLRAWLYTVARNKQRNARRFLLFDFRKKEDAAREFSEPQESPDQSLQRKQQLAAMSKALASLPAAQRELILLSVVEGLPASAIALVLNMREDAVRKRLSRARADLRALLVHPEGTRNPLTTEEPET